MAACNQDVLLPSHVLHVLWGDPNMFPDQMEDVTPPAWCAPPLTFHENVTKTHPVKAEFKASSRCFRSNWSNLPQHRAVKVRAHTSSKAPLQWSSTGSSHISLQLLNINSLVKNYTGCDNNAFKLFILPLVRLIIKTNGSVYRPTISLMFFKMHSGNKLCLLSI